MLRLHKTPEELDQERYEIEFKQMVEKIYGKDIPLQDPEVGCFGQEDDEDWDEYFTPDESEEEAVGVSQEEGCSRGCVICFREGCSFWV